MILKKICFYLKLRIFSVPVEDYSQHTLDAVDALRSETKEFVSVGHVSVRVIPLLKKIVLLSMRKLPNYGGKLTDSYK